MTRFVLKGNGTAATPWQLRTPNRKAEFLAYRDETADPPALVILAGPAEVRYDLRVLADLQARLAAQGDWMALGAADETKTAEAGTVEAWARSSDNPVGGWYGLTLGRRGRVGNYVPPVLEALGLAELEHRERNNRMRARPQGE
jgi:hypothetical protein